MGVRGLFEGWHLVVLIILIILLFGWKRLPDAARSLGRSMRIFKDEVEEMKGDKPSAASQDTVRGERVQHDSDAGPREADAVHREPGENDSSRRDDPPADGDQAQQERVYDSRDPMSDSRPSDSQQPRA